ncbi:MaoC family dehydratase [Barrientosiimonas marina]|uniref:MaoC/PaaZ C-terminal domain-containing protein n=1 Tax=Lentibacillus kimchii TaxID=1542911 RepID=A0ABW2URG3_9BACI
MSSEFEGGDNLKFAAFNLNDQFTTNQITVRKEDMVDYAKKYDPQYLHLDEERAKAGPFGALIASGFYTMNVVWAEFIRMDVLGKECLGGLSADHIKWVKPVMANDRLMGVYTVIDKQLLSDHTRGVLTMQTRITNQHNAEVLSFTFKVLVDVT